VQPGAVDNPSLPAPDDQGGTRLPTEPPVPPPVPPPPAKPARSARSAPAEATGSAPAGHTGSTPAEPDPARSATTRPGTAPPPTGTPAPATPQRQPAVQVAAPAGARHRPPRRRLRLPAGLGICAGYLLGALYVLQRQVGDPRGHVQLNVPDQTLFEWALGFGSRVVTDLINPFFTGRLNAPVGVNLMANTSVLGISVPFTPVTLLFGSAVSYLVFAVLGLAGTAAAWYYVLARHVVRSRVAAAVGGGFAGFAPPMISHSYGHPNIVAQFLVPFIAWRTIRLREPHRWLRNGIALGLLVTWQAFINEEVLLLTACGLVVFVLAYALMRPSTARTGAVPFLAGALVAGLLAGALLAYPLLVQFHGPQHGLGANTSGPRPYPADLVSFVSFSRDSLAGNHAGVGALAQNISEQNSFYGWPIVLLLIGATALMWRSRLYLSGMMVALALAALSLGGRITVHGRQTGVPGPWTLLAGLPVFQQVVPTRIAVLLAAVFGLLLALAYDRVAALTVGNPFGMAGLLWHGLLIAALVPLVPVPLATRPRPPVPAFITAGTWQRYVDERHSLVGIPAASLGNLEAMRWAAITRAGFAIPGGYYLAPDGSFGAPPRPTSTLLDTVAATGRVPRVTGRQIDQAAADLRFWRAAVVVIVSGSQTDAVVRTVTDLLDFQPTPVDGVWLWDVRRVVG
jgi:hypothetical protein